MALLIPADSALPIREVTPLNGTDFKIAQLYQLLDCNTIEIVHLTDGRIMVIDEEGKGGKKRNERATQLVAFPSPKEFVAQLLQMREAGLGVVWAGEPLTDEMIEVDYIAGDALVCLNREVQ